MRSPWLPALSTAVLAVMIALAFRVMVIDASNFAPLDLEVYEARSYGVDLPDHYGHQPFFLTWSRGDGGAFLALAADPLARGPARELGISAYRFGRVGYSLAAAALVWGRTELLPVGLFAANTLAVAAFGWFAGGLRRRHGPWSMLLVLNPALLIAYAADTAEAFGLLFLMLSVVLVSRTGRTVASVVLAVSRPSYLPTVLIRRSNIGPTLTGVLVVVIVQLVAVAGMGLVPGGSQNITAPLVGYMSAWPGQDLSSRLVAALVVVAALAAVVTSLRRRAPEDLGLLLTSGLVLVLSADVVTDWVNLLRATGGLVFALGWSFLRTRSYPTSPVGSVAAHDEQVASRR